MRNDTGALFENFIINELRKQNEYSQSFARFYFWRNIDQREIDLIVEKNNRLHLFEIKWNPEKKVKLTKGFTNLYGESELNIVHRDNFDQVISAFASLLEAI